MRSNASSSALPGADPMFDIRGFEHVYQMLLRRGESQTDSNQIRPLLRQYISSIQTTGLSGDAAMKSILVFVPAIAGLIALPGAVAAQAPVAVVEDVKGKVAGVEFMDYVAAGKVIKLGPKDSIVLGYMNSCWRETITGGTVVVGSEQSLVHLGVVQREKVDCDAGKMQLTSSQANQSAAAVFRSMAQGQQGGAAQPLLTLYGLSPVFEMKGRGTLVIERLDQKGERHDIAIGGGSLVKGKFYDLAKDRRTLTPGATYLARFGAHQMVFRIDSQAKPGATPIIGRLVRLG
jgi:hypothetical protein